MTLSLPPPILKLVADNKQNKPNSPFEMKNAQIPQPPAQPKANPASPTTPKTDPKDLPPVEEKGKKVPFYKTLRKGSGQFSAMPSTQQFSQPPQTPPVANTDLPTQPQANTASDLRPKPKKIFTPIKLLIFVVLLLIIGVITISATLVATEYTLYEPPEPIKNFIETVYSGGNK